MNDRSEVTAQGGGAGEQVLGTADGASEGAVHPALDRLPELRTRQSPAEVVQRLEALARRGKLAGFRARSDGVLFEAECFAEPFDRVLEARATTEGGVTRLVFSARTLWRAPAIMILVTALTIWPGVWLTDSMMRTYFSWYHIPTWWWYMPVTIVPLFWMVPRMVKKSDTLARESAAVQIAAISGALDRAP